MHATAATAVVLVITLCDYASAADRRTLYARVTFDGDRAASVDGLFAGEPDAAATVREYAAARPHLTYAALQCVYADGLADAMRTFYRVLTRALPDPSSAPGHLRGRGVVDRLAAVVADLDGAKRPLERMAYNLFYHADRHPRLRTADRGLLKTVLSLNAFHLYGREKTPFRVLTADGAPDVDGTVRAVRALRNSVGQTVGLVERFRYKNCAVDDERGDRGGPETDDATAVRSKIDRLNRLVDEGPVTYDGGSYVAGMYDPRNFLLEGAVLGSAFVAKANATLVDGRTGPLEYVYRAALAAYDIESILAYQNLLLRVIGLAFVRQIYGCLGDTDRVDALRALNDTLDRFVRVVLPNNCDSNVCGFVLDVHVKLGFIVFKLDRGVLKTRDVLETKGHLRALFDDGRVWTSAEQIQSVDGARLSSLVDRIVGDEGFGVFRQVAALLSYESNTNRVHGVLKVHDMPTSVRLPVGDRALDAMSKLQSVLHALRNACVQENRAVNDRVRRSLLYATHFAVGVFDEFDGDGDVRNAILPLLVYLRHVHNDLRVRGRVDFINLERMLWFTVTVIENHLFREYKWLTVGPQAYNVNNGPEMPGLNTDGIDAERLYGRLDRMYGRLYFDEELFPSNDTEGLRFCWNGVYRSVGEIFRAAPRSVIDVHDLINHRLLLVKWFAAKVLSKMKHALARPRELWTYSSNWKRILVDDLHGLLLADVPFRTNDTVGAAIDLFIAAIGVGLPPPMYSDCVAVAKTAVERSLSSLGAAANTDPFDSMSDIVNGLMNDVQKFQETVLKINNENELIFFPKPISISVALFPV